MLTSRLRHRAGDERGAILVMSVLVMTTLLIAAGLVLDIALVRTDRQQNKSAADVAVAAGMRNLELGGYPAPFRGVCDAVKYLKVNDSELSAMTGTWTDGTLPAGIAIGSADPCSTSAPEWMQLCIPNTPSTWAWYHGTADGGRLVVDIKNGYAMSDGTFADESLTSSDTGDTALGNCDNLAVMIRETEQPGFGRLALGGTMTTRIRSVARITQSIDATAVIALLLLERHDCEVLSFSGSNAAVAVQGNGNKPGIIHSDSIGDGANCNNQILDGVAASTGGTPPYVGPSILAGQAETGSPAESGHVSVTALSGVPGAMPGRAATACPSTVVGAPSSCPTGSSYKGRINVDVLYRARIASLQADAAAETAWTTGTVPSGWTVYNSCNSVPPLVTAQKVFVHCSNFNNAVIFAAVDQTNDQQVVFDGGISGSQTMTFQGPTKLYVANGLSRSGGTFSVNIGTSTDCTSRFAIPGARTKTAKVVIANGALSTSGGATLHLCGTMVLMGDSSSGGNSCPNLPAIPATNGVVPYDNCFAGTIGLSGGGSLDWTAPNATDSALAWDQAASQPYLANFEDLAFWTESASNSSSLSGGGSNNMRGIFFLPNANSFHITGNGGQVIDSDAQFIVRKLIMGGNGLLRMKPNLNDSVKFPYFSNFSMVR
jgi:hypothetical protein